MKKLLLVLIVLMFSCELNPYMDRECEIIGLNISADPIAYNVNIEWEQRGGLPNRESFTVNQTYYESLTIGDIIIYSDIILEIE